MKQLIQQDTNGILLQLYSPVKLCPRYFSVFAILAALILRYLCYFEAGYCNNIIHPVVLPTLCPCARVESSNFRRTIDRSIWRGYKLMASSLLCRYENQGWPRGEIPDTPTFMRQTDTTTPFYSQRDEERNRKGAEGGGKKGDESLRVTWCVWICH